MIWFKAERFPSKPWFQEIKDCKFQQAKYVMAHTFLLGILWKLKPDLGYCSTTRELHCLRVFWVIPKVFVVNSQPSLVIPKNASDKLMSLEESTSVGLDFVSCASPHTSLVRRGMVHNSTVVGWDLSLRCAEKDASCFYVKMRHHLWKVHGTSDPAKLIVDSCLSEILCAWIRSMDSRF